MNAENMSEKKKRIVSSQELRLKKIVTAETEKINNLLANIPTNNTTELNDLIFAGVKLIRGNIGDPHVTAN